MIHIAIGFKKVLSKTNERDLKKRSCQKFKSQILFRESNSFQDLIIFGLSNLCFIYLPYLFVNLN